MQFIGRGDTTNGYGCFPCRSPKFPTPPTTKKGVSKKLVRHSLFILTLYEIANMKSLHIH